MEGLNKKEKGLMDMDNSVGIAGRRGVIRGQNGNGKNTVNIILKILTMSLKTINEL